MFPRLYAILDVDAARTRGLEPVAIAEDWLDAGVRLLQLRAKSLPSGALLDLAETLSTLCRGAGASFVVNDRADIARLSGATGVHVGQTDLSPTAVRRVLPQPALVGLSTHTREQIEAAMREPIDYLAIGPVFETRSKAQPDPVVGLDGVRLAAERGHDRGWPVVAIGGITLERVGAVLDAGADAVAVISDLLDADPAARARAFLRAIGDGRSPAGPRAE